MTEQIKLIALYKPTGYVVTRQDERNRPTVYELLPKKYKDLIYIGRLDINSEGLLLFTNNGQFAQDLMRPINAIEREYLVRVA